MAHFRERHVQQIFKKLVAFSPILGVFGHRQVGKSTWLASVCRRYYTFDDEQTLLNVSQNPKLFLSKQIHFPTGIDECQSLPKLFPALKERVRSNRKPGQFILSGSVRFTSRKAIRESLAGRLYSIDLYPLSIAELSQLPLQHLLPQLMRSPQFSEALMTEFRKKAEESKIQRSLDTYLKKGGLPGLCFLREERLIKEGLQSLHHLILDRDLRMVYETKLSLETLMRFLGWIASLGMNPYQAAEVKRKLGLAVSTQKQLLYALESVYLIRKISMIGRTGSIYLLEDQLEQALLSSRIYSATEALETLVYRNIRTQFTYAMGEGASYESLLLRTGARVPLVITQGTKKLGIIITEGEPTLAQRRSGDRFLSLYSEGKVIFMAPKHISPVVLGPRTLSCSIAALI